MPQRENALHDWLETTLNHKNYKLLPLTGDASFRRYFRLEVNGKSYVVMDAPPPQENIHPFIQVAQILSQAQVAVPQLLAQDTEQGFLLLSDLGDQLLLSHLKPDTADHYYNMATKTLLNIQQIPQLAGQLPLFDKAHMLQEMSLCIEWFLQGYLKLRLTQEELDCILTSMNRLAEEIAMQPQVVIHRDFHSRNLMLTADDSLSVIDFQDAMYGPLTYDLVSLLKDCYLSWPREKTLQWTANFHTQSALAQQYSPSAFTRAFDLCGLQRHIKVLGIFSRLHLRDNKSGYLQDIPRVLDYVLACTAIYSEWHPLHNFLQQRVNLP